MSSYAFEAAWKVRDISAVEKLVMIYIAEAAGMDVWIRDAEQLRDFCNCSAREIEVALITLRCDHLIGQRESSTGRGRGFFVVTVQ